MYNINTDTHYYIVNLFYKTNKTNTNKIQIKGDREQLTICKYHFLYFNFDIFLGCDLNVKNLLGQTPLMRAVLFDDIGTVKLLHKSGK